MTEKTEKRRRRGAPTKKERGLVYHHQTSISIPQNIWDAAMELKRDGESNSAFIARVLRDYLQKQ